MNWYHVVYVLNVFFFVYMFIYAIFYFFNTFLAALKLDDFLVRKKHMSYVSLKHDENYIPISILVPSYNEEVTVCDTIESLLCLDYPGYEIIVVNDGSTDETANVLKKTYQLKKVVRPIRKQIPCKEEKDIYEGVWKGVKITLINKENGGKADALNMGINACNYPLYVCMDADSVLQKDALRKIVEPFLESDLTIAAGGNIKVSNHIVMKEGEVVEVRRPQKFIVVFQMLEYLRVFLTSRVAMNGLNSNLIISGAFAIFSKQAAIHVGGYTQGVIGEDMDIVVKMHAFYRKNKIPYRIDYVPDAVCWTQVPEEYKILRRQRRRWHIGMSQSLISHFFLFLNPKYGATGMLIFPYFVIFEWLAPIIEILGIFTIVLSYFLKIINIKFFFCYLIVYMGYNMLITWVSVLLERHLFVEKVHKWLVVKLLLFGFLENFGYRQICSVFRLTALFSVKRKNWGEMTRTKNLVYEEEI